MHHLSIYILHEADLKQLQRCVDQIASHCHGVPIHIITPDRSARSSVSGRFTDARILFYDLVADFQESLHTLNALIHQDPTEFKLICRDDVEISEDIFTPMRMLLAAGRPNGIITPNCQPNPDLSSSDRPGTACEGLSPFLKLQSVPKKYLITNCALIRTDAFEKIGELDTELDSLEAVLADWSFRARLKNYRSILASGVIVKNTSDIKGRIALESELNKKWKSLDISITDKNALNELYYLDKATDAFMSGRIDEINKVIEEWRQNGGRHEYTHLSMIELLINASLYDLAWQCFLTVPDPEKSDDLILHAAYIKAGLGDHQAAKQFLEILSINDLNSARKNNLIGRLAYSEGAPDTAKEAFLSAINQDPTYAEAYANLATFYWEEGDHEKAVQLYTRAFVLSPLDEDIIGLFQERLSAENRCVEVEEIINTIVNLYPNSIRLRHIQIDFAIMLKQHNKALRLVQKCMARFGIDNGILEPAKAIQALAQKESETRLTKTTSILSVCLIVKDEEEYLTKCLDSIRDIADEIVIVDTGSSDRSISIAQVFGAKIVEESWQGNFAAARNVYLQHAKADWILVMDADEVISAEDHKTLRKLISHDSHKKIAYTITTRNYNNNSTIIGWTANEGEYPSEERGTGWIPTQKVRLFPNDPKLEYQFPVHEMLEPSLKKQGYECKRIAVPVHHYGNLNREKVERKDALYYQLGVKKLAKNGEDPHNLGELAIQAGILKKYAEAIDYWKRFLRLKPDNPEAYICMTTALIHLGDYQKAFECASKAMQLAPNRREALYNYSIALLYSGRAQAALEIVNRLCQDHEEFLPGRFAGVTIHFSCNEFEKGKAILQRLKKTQLGPVLDISFEAFVKGLIRTEQMEYVVSIIDGAKEYGYNNEHLEELRCQAMRRIRKAN